MSDSGSSVPKHTVPPCPTQAMPYTATLLGQLDRRWLSRPMVPGVLAALLLAVLIVPGVQLTHRIQKKEASVYREAGERNKSALGRWLPTAAVLFDDPTQNPYGSGHWFPTPPLVLITLYPLAKMSVATAGAVWSALKIAGFLLVMSLLIREVGRDAIARGIGTGVPVGVLLMVGVFSLRPIVSDLQHGNLNIFMMIWLGLTWFCFMRGKDGWAGLFLALAIVTKVTPALLLMYFIYKRAWRVCVGAMVGLILVFVVVPGLFLGFERNIQLLRDWFDMLVAPFAWHGYATLEIENQSLYGVLLRLLSNAGLLSIEPMPAAQALAAGMEDMARPITALGRLLRPAFSLGMLGVLVWACRTRNVTRRDPRLLLEFAVVLLAMLLMSERTWKHHATTLPFVFLGVWYVLTCRPWSDRFRAWFVAGLMIQLVLLLGTSEGLWGDRLGELFLDGGVFCWGLVLCFIQTLILLRGSGKLAGETATGG